MKLGETVNEVPWRGLSMLYRIHKREFSLWKKATCVLPNITHILSWQARWVSKHFVTVSS